ncbi:MAG: YwaF family protein [Lachnospiraceae bacterium]|nr:YwaF family protein [Lachnospiraceae bacterium]
MAARIFRNAGRQGIGKWLKIQAVITPVLELVKIGWESYYDITTGRGFNAEGLLPLYTCSLLIYLLPLAAWGKGRARDCALAFLTTIGMLFGAVGVIYCNGLNFYPFWTFGAFYSLYFHTSMFLTGVVLLASGTVRPEWKNVRLSFIPVVVLAVIAVPVDYALSTDYMLLYSGSGVPLYEGLAARLAEKGLRQVYTLIMLLTHLPLAALVVGVCRAAERIPLFGRRERE